MDLHDRIELTAVLSAVQNTNAGAITGIKVAVGVLRQAGISRRLVMPKVCAKDLGAVL